MYCMFTAHKTNNNDDDDNFNNNNEIINKKYTKRHDSEQK